MRCFLVHDCSSSFFVCDVNAADWMTSGATREGAVQEALVELLSRGFVETGLFSHFFLLLAKDGWRLYRSEVLPGHSSAIEVRFIISVFV